MIRICVTASGPDLDSLAIPNIQTAPFLQFYEIVDDNFVLEESILNPYKVYKVIPEKLIAEFIVTKGANVLISGNLPDLTLSILKSYNVKVYVGILRSVKENIQMFLEEKLEEI